MKRRPDGLRQPHAVEVELPREHGHTRLVGTLPAPLKDAIPSVEELERGLTDFSD